MPLDARNPACKENERKRAHLQRHAQKFRRTKVHVSARLTEIDEFSVFQPGYQLCLRTMLCFKLRRSRSSMHFLMLGKPAEVAGEILGFLEKVSL